MAVTTSEVSPKDRSPIPPALPTSTTGASTMLIPRPRRSAPRSAAADSSESSDSPARSAALASSPTTSSIGWTLPALVVDRHEQRQVVTERGDERALVPDRGAAAHEDAARPGRALEQRQHVVRGVAVDTDHQRHRQASAERQLVGGGRARAR